MKFLGIDGGGTSTTFLLVDEGGNILSESRLPTSHYKQTSFSNFRSVLEEGVNNVCQDLDITREDIDFSFVGIPGFGEIARDTKKLEDIAEDVLATNKYKCGNDAEVAWAGSLACNPGINIVAGTGAIGYGIDYKGNIKRAGGWGDFCGDEGSAHWLGKKLIETFTKQADGRIPKTYIYDLVREKLELEHDFEILNHVLNKLEKKRDEIAALGELLFIAAENGDEVAKKIFKEAAFEHFLTIRALIEKLEFIDDKEILVSYSGGVFNAEEYVLDPLESLIKEYKDNIKLIKPILNPASGAALYAIVLAGRSIKGVVERLQEQ